MRGDAVGLDYKVGDRVVIVRAGGTCWPDDHRLVRRDPHPEHLGKTGVITKLLEDKMPIIRLSDGIELEGCDCWWSKLAEGW